MIKIKNKEQDHYISFASHHSDFYKRHVVSNVLQSINQNGKSNKWADDTNHNCGSSFIINITDTEDDGLPYPDVEDYKIPNRWEDSEDPTSLYIYFFKANYEVDQEEIDKIIKEERELGKNKNKFL